jgi:hypothetical protein
LTGSEKIIAYELVILELVTIILELGVTSYLIVLLTNGFVIIEEM